MASHSFGELPTVVGVSTVRFFSLTQSHTHSLSPPLPVPLHPSCSTQNYVLAYLHHDVFMHVYVCSASRFEGSLNVDLNEITMNLVPFPRLHYLVSSISPLYTSKDIGVTPRK